MSQTRKKKRKVRGKIKFKQSARLVHRNDNTRVDKKDVSNLPKVKTKRVIPDNAATFKIKIRKK